MSKESGFALRMIYPERLSPSVRTPLLRLLVCSACPYLVLLFDLAGGRFWLDLDTVLLVLSVVVLTYLALEGREVFRRVAGHRGWLRAFAGLVLSLLMFTGSLLLNMFLVLLVLLKISGKC